MKAYQHLYVTGSVNISGSLLLNGDDITSAGGGNTSVYISGSAPSGSATGSLWFNENDLNMYVRYFDGTSSYWLPVDSNQTLYANSSSYAATASLADFATSASVAQTASFVNTLRQPVTISGSVNISGSLLVNGLAPGVGGGATVTITGSVPSGSANSGSLWWNNTDGNLYIQVTSPTGSTYVPATNTVAGGNYGATFTFAATGSTWNINHNLNTTTPLVTVYSGSSVMIPATITSLDANNTRITFSGSVAGTAILSTGIGNATTNNAVSASFATTASLTVNATSASFATSASALIGSQAEYLLAGKSTSQTFVLGNNTINNFDTPTVNTLVTSSWNGTTGTFTAGRTATYRVGASFIVNQAVDGPADFYSLAVLKNGSQAAEQLQMIYSNANTFKPNILIPILVPVVAGDTLTFRWYQSINGNRTNTAAATQNYITIEELPTRIQK